MTTFLICAAVVLVILYGWYFAIISARNSVSEALGGIDAQLQQRHDLIPNVLAIARRFMEHEKSLLDEITTLRAKAQPQIGLRDLRDFAGIAEKFNIENALAADMTKLFALAENYPQLTSSGPMMEAQRTYRDVETNIAAARRFYNSAVNQLKTRVEVFPGPLVRGVAGVRELPPFYQAAEGATGAVRAIDHL